MTDLKREKNNVADVKVALLEQRNNLLGYHVRLFEADRPHPAQFNGLDDQLSVEPTQLFVTLTTDTQNLDLSALGDQRICLFAGKAHDRRIERPAKSTFGGADHQ